jgi:hypothetical protein
MEENVDFPYKTVITFSIFIAIYQFILFYSVKISRIIYINFIKENLKFVSKSFSVLLSIIFGIAALSMQLISALSHESDQGYQRKLYNNLFHNFIVLALCFEFIALLFDIFQWIYVFSIAPISVIHGNNELDKQLKRKEIEIFTALYMVQVIILVIFIAFFIHGCTILNE